VGESLTRMLKNGLRSEQKRSFEVHKFNYCVLNELQVIVTSYLFPEAKFSLDRLQKLVSSIGKERLVIDLRQVFQPDTVIHLESSSSPSCRRRDSRWFVAMNKWQDITDLEITQGEGPIIL
jgi:hypothetical protein